VCGFHLTLIKVFVVVSNFIYLNCWLLFISFKANDQIASLADVLLSIENLSLKVTGWVCVTNV